VTAVETAEVGRIDLTGGNRGSGVNVNCDSVTCYAGLEKLDVRDFPVFGAGAVAYTNTSTLSEWYIDLLFLLGNTSCTDAYANQFDASKACVVDTDPAVLAECKANVTALSQALDYVNAQDFTFSGLGACLPDPAGHLKVPTNATLASLASAKQTLQDCQAAHLSGQVLAHYASLDLPNLIGNASRVVSSPGVAEDLTFSALQDPLWNDLRTFLWKTVDALGLATNASYPLLRSQWLAQHGLSSADFLYEPRLWDLCDAAFPLAAVVTDPVALENFCAVARWVFSRPACWRRLTPAAQKP
jgi:hypothetical protein